MHVKNLRETRRSFKGKLKSIGSRGVGGAGGGGYKLETSPLK